MIFSASELKEFWSASTTNIPIIIIGGGRWGRVWSIAISRGRGSGAGVTIVARKNFEATLRWAQDESGFPEIIVVSNLFEGLKKNYKPALAIIASRPQDHIRDAIEAMQAGLDVLIEKPICDRAQLGSDLKIAAEKNQVLMAINTEFALLPAFHCCAKELKLRGTEISSIHLRWGDSPNEIRYGSIKRHHDEIGLLVDLIPHAHSIFRIFSRGDPLYLVDVFENTSRQNGWAIFRDKKGCQYKFFCDKKADDRQRQLSIEGTNITASIDFNSINSIVKINNIECTNQNFLGMNSTLRLMLGAFLKERTNLATEKIFSGYFEQLLDLQSSIENRLTY